MNGENYPKSIPLKKYKVTITKETYVDGVLYNFNI